MSDLVEGEAKASDKKKKKKTSKTVEEKRKQSVKETNEDSTPQPPTEIPNEIDQKHVESVAEGNDKIIGESEAIDEIIESQEVTNIDNEIQDVNKEDEERVVENEEEKEEVIIPKETKDTVKEEKGKKKNFVREEDLQMLCEMKEAFHLFDVNRDGVIDLEDLQLFYASIGIPDFPIEQINKMLAERPEPMDFDAFVNLFGCKIEMCMDPEEVFTEALSKWDMRDKGYISERRFKRDLELRGPDFFSPKDIETALEEAPIHVDNGKSLIDYQAFSNNICGMQKMPECRRYQKMNNDV